MSEGLPSYIFGVLNTGEKVISYVSEPDLAARKRILIAVLPPIMVLISALLYFLIERESAVASAAGVYCVVAFAVFALRLLRTSYLISDKRIVRFVKEKVIEDVELDESSRPTLLNYSESTSLIYRWMARFLSVGPTVEIRRHKPKPWSLAAFFIGGDPSRLCIGYPGHSLPIAKTFDLVVLAWEAAQDMPKGTE